MPNSTSATALLKTLVAQASFIAALMFYLGAMYTSSFYGYFHLSLGFVNFGFAELVLQSLHLLRYEVLIAIVVLVLAVALPHGGRRLPDHAAQAVFKGFAALARQHPAVVAAGGVMLLMWTQIQPYGWAAPLTIATGILLGQSQAAQQAHPQGLRRRAVLLLAAGFFLFWALTQAAVQLGEKDARARASDVLSWTGVVVHSTEPLALPPSISEQDLGERTRHRYRYTGLRLLLEQDGRYIVVPHDWNGRTAAIYVIPESDTTWMALMPGLQDPVQQ